MTSFINASLIMWALAFIYAPPSKSSPTLCEFVTIEYQAALDRGDITEREFWHLVKKCQRFEQGR